MTLDQRARDAATAMREKLDAITIPEPASVLRRARRRRFRGGALAIVAVASTVAIIAAVTASGSPSRIEVSGRKGQPSPAPTTVASRPFTLDPRVSGCFDLPSTADATAETPTVGHDTTVSSRLLVLADDGTLWVIDGDKATLWSVGSVDTQYSGIVWARWLTDGSILAARVGHADVELDELSAPNQSVAVAHLPYTAVGGAAPGECRLNGYPASFAVIAAGVVFLHSPGTLQCEDAQPVTDPQTQCGTPFFPEVRPASDLSVAGPGNDVSQGGTLIASASRASNTIVIYGPTVSAMIVGPVDTKCCFGGQAGTAYTISPDGHQLAYASATDSQQVRVAAIGYLNTRVQQLGAAIWRSPDPIKSMAWINNTLAVAHGNSISLVTVPTGTVVGEVNFNSAIRTMDFQPPLANR
jgi:hypothetical protein